MAVEDREVPRRHADWVRYIDDQSLPFVRTARERVLSELLEPSTSLLYRNLHIRKVDSMREPMPMPLLVALDAPYVSEAPADRLCDWGANEEFIIWVPIDPVVSPKGTLCSRHMHTKVVNKMATFNIGRVRGVRWNPTCDGIGVASDLAIARMDPVTSAFTWQCRVLGPTTTVDWFDGNVLAACIAGRGGVAVCDTHIKGERIALNIRDVAARIVSWSDRGIAVASGNSVSTYDVRKCVCGSPLVTRHYEGRVTALDWKPQALAVGTEEGVVRILREAGDEPIVRRGAGAGLVGIAWDPFGYGITALSKAAHLISFGNRGIAYASCIDEPMYLVRNGDRTRVIAITAGDTALAFKVHEKRKIDVFRRNEGIFRPIRL